MRWAMSNSTDIVVPNYFIGTFECDLMKVTKNGVVYEYEIKTSKSDFKNDFKKSRYSYKQGSRVTKHELIKEGKRCNRFYFVCPEGLILSTEVPKDFGLIYAQWIDGHGYTFRIVKVSKLFNTVHKVNWQHLANNLCLKLMNAKRRILTLKNKT